MGRENEDEGGNREEKGIDTFRTRKGSKRHEQTMQIFLELKTGE
jgi:hypothetical protein